MSNTHSLYISNRSKAAALESKLSKFKKFLDDDTRTEYNKHEIDEFIEESWIKRWKNTQNKGLLQYLPNTQPQLNTCCPLTIGDPYVVNKICELVIGNSFAFAEYAWNMWKCESPMCICGKSGVGGSRSKERDRKSELVLRSTYQIFEWDRNNSDRNFYYVIRYVHLPLVP